MTLENPECVGADADAGDILKESRPNVGQSRFCLVFPHPAEVTDLVGGVAVARVRQCGGELRVGSGALVGIESRPIVPPVHSPRAHFRSSLS